MQSSWHAPRAQATPCAGAVPQRAQSAQDFINRDVMGTVDYISPTELQTIRAKAENYVVDIYKTPRQDWQNKKACPIVDVITACKAELGR